MNCIPIYSCAIQVLVQQAEQGMRFTDFHTNSSVCSPTRAAFLTGRYQQRVGIVDVIVGSREPESGISPSIPTLPRVFKDNGYATALFGKWHCGYQDQYNPVHHGFDEFVGFLNGATDYHNHGAWRVGLEKQNVPGYSTRIITDRSIDFIKRNKDNPFFLYVSHAAVHNPYQTVEDTPDRRVKGENPNRINDKNRDKYRWMLQDLDQGVGQILDTLNELELAENTLVVFFSDNGAVGMSPKEFRRFRGGKFQGAPARSKGFPGQRHLLRIRTQARDGHAARRLENDRQGRKHSTVQPSTRSPRNHRCGRRAS